MMTRDMKMLIVPWVIFSICVVYSEASSPLVTEYEWKYFDYVWKSIEQKKWYVANSMYVPMALDPIDVARAQDGRTFVTIIRGPGVPASLNTVSKEYSESGPLLKPYPNWSWYNPIDPCKGIVNVYRVAIDRCNRLWVLDTGSFDFKKVCSAKLLVFDLHTDNLIFQQDIDDKITYNAKGEGLLITPIVDTVGSRCEDTTVYIGDVTGRALIVWHNFEAIRLENLAIFGPEKEYTNHKIANESFFLDDGILGMALSPQLEPDGHRFLVFRPFASRSVYAADTLQLKDALQGGTVDYIKAKDVLPGEGSAQAFSSDGTLFYGLAEQIAIGCWNIQRPMIRENFKTALVDEKRLQFVSGMKVFQDPVKPEDEYVLVMTNRLQKIYSGTLDLKEYNFRVMLAPVKDLIEAGQCKK